MSKSGWKNLARRAIQGTGLVWISSIALVVAIGVTLSAVYWEDLRGTQDSLSTTVRNVALVVGGVIAILLAVWRSRVAEQQATTSQEGLLNERYQKGAEMLGSEVLSVRMGGIYALQRLSEEHPEQYHVQIMRLFCAFVRHPTQRGESETPVAVGVVAAVPDETPVEASERIREDVQAVMEAIGYRNRRGISLEMQAEFTLNLRGADIRNASLEGANLSGANFTEASLRHARLTHANLSRAILWHADLASFVDPELPVMYPTLLDGANLRGANLMYANLFGARLQGAHLCLANLLEANLSSAFLYGAKLIGADISLANLTGTILDEADVSSIKLSKGNVMGSWLTLQYEDPTTRLTQEQLNKAFAEPGSPPQLNGVLDERTGLPLVWEG